MLTTWSFWLPPVLSEIQLHVSQYSYSNLLPGTRAASCHTNHHTKAQLQNLLNQKTAYIDVHGGESTVNEDSYAVIAALGICGDDGRVSGIAVPPGCIRTCSPDAVRHLCPSVLDVLIAPEQKASILLQHLRQIIKLCLFVHF